MTLNGSPIADRPQGRLFRSAIAAVLATAAILLGLLAIHSAATGPEMNAALPAASAHATQPSGADAIVTASGVAAAAAAAHTVEASIAWGSTGMSGCALIVLGCGLLLILAALLRLARSPAVHDRSRSLEDVRRLFQSIYAPPLHVHRPSLTVLSVSRV